MLVSIRFRINFVLFPTSEQTPQGLNKAETGLQGVLSSLRQKSNYLGVVCNKIFAYQKISVTRTVYKVISNFIY